MNSKSSPRRRRDQGGWSLTEMLAVVALIGVITTMSLGAMNENRRRAAVVEAARQFRLYVTRARMQAVYQGRPYFVVFDPDPDTGVTGEGPRISLVVDTNRNGRLESDELQLRWERGVDDEDSTTGGGLVEFHALSGAVALDLRTFGSITDPNGGTDLTEAWDIELPDSAAGWGSARRGVMVNPRGNIMTGETVPQIITAGAAVFTDATGRASAVSIRGGMGHVRAYYMPEVSSTADWIKL
ncbi:MAG: type II secretion system protein [Acidobacteriota bacterium]